MRIASIVINAVIFAATTVLLVRCFHKEGQWRLRQGLKAFRYFTVLSNAFCALTALAMAIGQLGGAASPAVLTFKYLGTVSVTVTLMTVFLFLGPTQGYRALLSGDSFYMHLAGPLLAIVSFCFMEKRGMTMATALTGLLPVLLYGVVYLNRVVYAPEEKRWEDFYGFNRGGKWPVAFGAMLVGTAVVCLLFWIV